MITNLAIALASYCHCARCCSIAHQPTASGRWPQVGVSIAAPRSVPFGTWVRIDGIGWRRVDDRTHPRIDGWDEFVGSAHGDHRKAKRLGIRRVRVLELRKDS